MSIAAPTWQECMAPIRSLNIADGLKKGGQIYFTMSTWNPYQVMFMTIDMPTPLE